ncbi:pre-B-cell leukemia homeobox interacting protein 1b isoform X1 [Alosa sapidissima]|uniref:pre-B-cell leukemia homeobox interacting protein 1b isoform X1 n=1 Tax=Alosa sapidissima TaxID=34773 RepID=UPI001C08FFE8|nr:pre-B-cell leukemia homeobox interacting protein 1b isoform X1 [Alosa sapidissima]
MSDNSNSANGNNWTIIPPEAPVAENVGPVLEDSRCHGDMSSSVDPDPPPGVQIESAHPPLQQMGPEPSSEAQAQPLLSSRAEALHGQSGTNQPVEQEPVSEGLSLDGLDDHTQNDDSTPSVVPLSSVAEGDESTGLDEHSVHDGYAEGHTHSSTETDLFSDSYTHISSTPDAIHTVEKEEELQEKEEGLDQGRKGTDEVILSDSPQESVAASAEGESEGDGLRRRRKVSLLGSLDGEREEEEEEEEEEYRPPPAREEEAGLSLNKCILGALLLLGLGTIFFSGVFMDLDEETDDVKELKDRDLAQEWLKSEGRPDAYAGVKHPGLVDKENEQIAVLQAQLQQAQKEQLTSAQQLLQEGVKEQERWEHLEEENLKMKGELESLPARQKELEQENERMRKEQEKSRRELDALKAKMGAVPSAGQPTEQQSSQDPQQKGGGEDAKDKKKPPKLEKEKVEKEQKKEWKKKEKKEEKEGKKDKGAKKEGGERKEGKEKKQHGTKEKRGAEEGKEWKDRGAKEKKEEKDWKKKEKKLWAEEGKAEKKERKEWKEDKKWKKDKSMDGHREVERKEWRELEEKREKRGGKDGEKKHREEDGAGKKDKKRKGDEMSDGKVKKEKKEWKDREERSEESDWRKRKEDGKKKSMEWRERTEERKHSGGKAKERSNEEEEEEEEVRGKGKEHGRAHKWKKPRDDHHTRNDRHKEQGRAAKHHKDDKKDNRGQITDDKTSSHLHDDDDDEHDDDGDASHLRGDYWSQQRQKLHHSRGPPAECSDAAACARAQGLVPVSLADFEALLLAYLDRLDVGAASSSEDQASRRQKLGALVREFFAADGLFVHDRTPFGEFVEDVSDILEDMAEEGENQEMEEEMEGFEKEALERFAMQEEGGKGGADRGEESKRRSGRVKG